MKNHIPMARPLGVRGYNKRSYDVGTHKMNDAIRVETSNESPTSIALDIDPRTVALYAQPLTFRLDLQRVFDTKSEALRAEPRVKPGSVSESGLECCYTPDFLVHLGEPVDLIVESKDDKEIEKLTAALERRKQILSSLGYRYLVVANSEFAAIGLHQNMVDVRDALRRLSTRDCKVQLAAMEEVVARFSDSFALGQIWNLVQPLSDIHKAVATGLIAYDLRSGKLTRDTVVWPAYGDLTHLQLLPLGA